MAPFFGDPNYNFVNERDYDSESNYEDEKVPANLTQMAFWYMIVLLAMLLTWLVVFFCLRIIALRQKTRNPQERRMYVGSRARPSFSQPEPTIYVSPNNLPPPPKYEYMAPPSYEEVVGVHYPQFQPQPITQPIATAMAQQSTDNGRSNASCSATVENEAPSTVITVTSDERRTSVTVATSS